MNAFFKVNLKMEGSDGERGSSIRKDGMRSLIDVAAARSGTFPASFCVLQQSEVFFLMFALAGLLGDGEEGRESRLCCGVRGYRGGKGSSDGQGGSSQSKDPLKHRSLLLPMCSHLLPCSARFLSHQICSSRSKHQICRKMSFPALTL